MQRRRFIAMTGAVLASSGLSLTGCTTTPLSTSGTPDANAGRRATIDADVEAALARLYSTVNGDEFGAELSS